MHRFLLVALVLIFSTGLLSAQSGEALYPFLNVPASTLASGVGGNTVSSQEKELNLTFHNPALLSTELHNQLEVSYINYISDILIGTAAYSRKIDERSAWMAGMRYLNYGEMPWTDAQDNLLGTTSASDLALTGTYMRKLSEHWQAGVSLHVIYSVLDEFTSVGLGTDLGLYYNNPNQLISFGFALKNAGAEVVAYDENYEKMPWDVQFGVSKKFAHAPFRFTLTVQDLTNIDQNYLNRVETTEGELVQPESVLSKMMKHTVLGVEFVPSDNFLLSVGYNHRRKTELALVQRTAFAGFSLGFSLKTKSGRIGASYAKYHQSGNSLQLSYSMNLSKVGL